MTINDPDDLFMSLGRSSRYSDLSVSSLRRRIASGVLRAYNVGDPDSPQQTIRVRKSDLDAMMRPVGQVSA